MKVLLACEESQAVCKEFRALGHEAYSCDLFEASGGHPEWHIKGDLRDVLDEDWDLIIGFPPCTYLTVTGNRWFNVDKYGDKAIERAKLREEAAKFFLLIAKNKCKSIAIENPVGFMSSFWRKPDQIIQPYEFGDPYEKKTCLWLKGLPKLELGPIVSPPPRTRYKSGKSMPSWYADAVNLPKEERSKIRSKTFPGIAKAMAEQWGGDLNDL